MHKFFCSYNNLTGKYELSGSKNNIFSNSVLSQAENDTMGEIKRTIQNLYDCESKLKDIIKDEDDLKTLDETELLLSNLYYSLFASPMEIEENPKEEQENKSLLTEAITLASNLEKLINIPEYNRIASIIRNNLQNILNKLD